MTHKQDAPSNEFPLPGWQVVEATGVDARAFLQAQLMNDVGALRSEHWQWNGWLNPKGRIIALCALVALASDRYWLVAPDFPAFDLASRLRRYVFRSTVSLRERGELIAYGNFAGPQQASGSKIDRRLAGFGDGVELDVGSNARPRALRITTMEAEGVVAMRCDEQATRWLSFDLAHGLPHLGIDQSEAWTPQMLSLDRLNAYSLKKGCYPGQEIVARTHYLGQAKRELVRLTGVGMQVGAEIQAGGHALGTVLSCVNMQALAVLCVERPSDGWTCAGSPCEGVPLLGGLER